MKKFLLRLLFFTIVTVVVFALFHFAIISQRKTLLQIDKNTHSVFLGNSTFEFGINDSLIPNTVNFAENAESVDLMYLKLKMLKEVNPQLDTVYIEFDDLILFTTSLVRVNTHAYYLDQLTCSDIYNNLKNMTFERNTAYLCHAYDFLKLRPTLAAFTGKSSGISAAGLGGYTDLYRDRLQVAITQTDEVPDKKNIQDIPIHNHYYYNRILDLCHDKDITPVFLANPMHTSCWKDTVYREYHRQYFPKVPLVDFHEFYLPDSCFADCIHLNYRGAAIYSHTLATYLLTLKTKVNL